jgi:hypothetical protein
MKKTAIVIILLSFCSLLPAAGGKFFVSAGAALLMPGDSNFADLYGKAQWSPEIRLGYNMYRNFYFWIGGSFVSASGTLPVLGDEIKASQTFVSLGAGWETKRLGRLQADLSAALLMAGSREKAMGTTVSKWAPGLDARAGLRYFLRENVFLGMSFGYAGAWTSVHTASGEKDIILGGLRLGAALGFRF